jgi:hypothetical protein
LLRSVALNLGPRDGSVKERFDIDLERTKSLTQTWVVTFESRNLSEPTSTVSNPE